MKQLIMVLENIFLNIINIKYIINIRVTRNLASVAKYCHIIVLIFLFSIFNAHFAGKFTKTDLSEPMISSFYSDSRENECYTSGSLGQLENLTVTCNAEHFMEYIHCFTLVEFKAALRHSESIFIVRIESSV